MSGLVQAFILWVVLPIQTLSSITMGGCYAHPIVIEDNVWIGAGVHIMGGVTIGRNSVIGAGSVVTKDVPENVIAAGVPCKVIREITDKDKTDFLG
jgi:maltose O-acetyltransferase